MALAENSSRRLLKATYAPIELTTSERSKLMRAGPKAGLLNALKLQPGEVDEVKRSLTSENAAQIPSELWSALTMFEPQPVPGLMPSPQEILPADEQSLISFTKALIAHRRSLLRPSSRPSTITTSTSSLLREITLPQRRDWAPANIMSSPRSSSVTTTALSVRIEGSLNSAIAALFSFEAQVKISPIGRLHLERIEMTPAGVERGELIASIPLAPRETVSITQKEWSVTSNELETIVQDYLEEYSEKGVTEKSELAQATETQTKHSTQLDLDSTVSGSYGMVTFSANSKFDAATADAQTQKDSRNHAVETTRKAATRARKEHKVTIKTTSVKGAEEVTTRSISNPSTTKTMRIDYFSMMRKWRVRLYRYGLRVTYDLVVPEPGAMLRTSYAALADLEDQISRAFSFDLEMSSIDRGSYSSLAAQYGAPLPPPPPEMFRQRIGGPVSGLGGDPGWHFFELPVDVPDGYVISSVWLDAMLGSVPQLPPPYAVSVRNFIVFGVGAPWVADGSIAQQGKASFVYDLSNYAGFLTGRTGHQKIVYFIQNIDAAAVTFTLEMTATNETMDAWRFNVWRALRDAASEAYYAGQQALGQKRDAVKAELTRGDTLTLRREEREEIMKTILRWLLGPAFDFMPPDVVKAFGKDPWKLAHGEAFIDNELGISGDDWMTIFRYEEMVKFIHHAIEWENVLYFLYPYFWDIPAAWDFVRRLDHPDPTRRAFLRAGCARVVLTIRPGFEEAFASFVERGEFARILPPNHPYITIGNEIRQFDQTNYPGIPPANAKNADYNALEAGKLIAEWNEYTPTPAIDIGITSKLMEIA